MTFRRLSKLKTTNFQVYFTLNDQRLHCDLDEESDKSLYHLKTFVSRWQKEKWHVTFGAKDAEYY